MGDTSIGRATGTALSNGIKAAAQAAVAAAAPPQPQKPAHAPAGSPHAKDADQTRRLSAKAPFTDCVRHDLPPSPPGLYVGARGDQHVYDEHGQAIPGLRAKSGPAGETVITDLRGRPLTNEQVDAAFEKFRGVKPADAGPVPTSKELPPEAYQKPAGPPQVDAPGRSRPLSDCVRPDAPPSPPGLFMGSMGDPHVYDERGQAIPGLRVKTGADGQVDITDLQGNVLGNPEVDAIFEKFRGVKPTGE